MLAGLLLLGTSVLGATEIHYLDLQQAGNSAIIVQKTANGGRKVILVDAGKASVDASRGGARLVEKLHDLKITHIDLAIFSHIDQDHFGGYRNLLGLTIARPATGQGDSAPTRGPPVTIGAIIEPGMPLEKDSYGTFLDDIETAHIPLHQYNQQGARAAIRELERELHIKLFAPGEPSSANASSLLVRVDDPRTGASHLLTGDTTPGAWGEVASTFPARRITTVTAPHHGGDKVLHAIIAKTSPRRLIVQVDAENQYNHPKLAIMRDLARHGHRVDLRYVERTYTLLEEEHGLVENYLQIVGADDLRSPTRKHLSRRKAAFAARVDEAQTIVRQTTGPFLYRDILITSERGDIRIKGERLTTAVQPKDTFIEEAIWYRARYLSDDDIRELKTWGQARTYLRWQVLDDLHQLQKTFTNLSGELDAVMAVMMQDASTAPRSDGPTERLRAAQRRHRVLPFFRLPAWVAEYERILLRMDATLDVLSVRDALATRVAAITKQEPVPQPQGRSTTANLYRKVRAQEEVQLKTRSEREDRALSDVQYKLTLDSLGTTGHGNRPRIVECPVLDLAGIEEFRLLDHHLPLPDVTPPRRYQYPKPDAFHPVHSAHGERLVREAHTPKWQARRAMHR
jgi:beta-lactamase superfamily II metal-dependent hydrolase